MAALALGSRMFAHKEMMTIFLFFAVALVAEASPLADIRRETSAAANQDGRHANLHRGGRRRPDKNTPLVPFRAAKQRLSALTAVAPLPIVRARFLLLLSPFPDRRVHG